MSSSAKTAPPGASPQLRVVVNVLGRVGVLVLAYAVAAATVAVNLSAVVMSEPVAVLFPKPPTVVARTPTLSILALEPAP